MNNVVLMGRLTKDPVIRQTNSTSAPVANFSLAVNRARRKDEKTNEQTADFPHIICFGKTAEFAEKYLKQGTRICIRGHIQTGSYANNAGQTIYTTDIIADQIEFAESKQINQESSEKDDSFEPIPNDAELPFK